jgi:hypothetical protein
MVAIFVAVAVAAPYYVHNAAVTGNPVFPFATPIFGSSPWKILEGAALPTQTAAQGLLNIARNVVPRPGEILMLPSRATADRAYLRGEPPLSPFVAVLIALAVVGAARLRAFRVWGVVCACFAVLVVRGDVRYLLPIVPFLCIAEAEGAVMLWRSRLERTPIAISIALIVLAPGFAYGAWKIAGKGRPPLNASDRDRYLSSSIPAYRAIRSLNERHGAKYVVYGLTAPNVRYFAAGRYLGEINGPASFFRVLGDAQSPGEIRANIRSLGAGYLIADRALIGTKVAGDIAGDPAFRVMERYDGVSLYVLAP